MESDLLSPEVHQRRACEEMSVPGCNLTRLSCILVTGRLLRHSNQMTGAQQHTRQARGGKQAIITRTTEEPGLQNWTGRYKKKKDYHNDSTHIHIQFDNVSLFHLVRTDP